MISPVTVLFPEYIIESTTDFFACEQLSSPSLAVISLLRAFSILNSYHPFLFFLRIGTQAPTFAAFSTVKGRKFTAALLPRKCFWAWREIFFTFLLCFD